MGYLAYVSRLEVEHENRQPALPVQESQRSQISDGHRLIQLAYSSRNSLYTRSEFLRRAVYVSPEDWAHSFITTLRMKMSRNVALRINATLGRARKQLLNYGVNLLGPSELIAEAMFDSTWFRGSEEHYSRSSMRAHVAKVLDKREPIELVFPVFSRKPTSPLKNRGYLPDLAEIVSLARLAEAAHVINTFSPTGCIVTLAADGHKYRRGCRTPSWIVDEYQSALQYWIEALGASSLLKLIDYETLTKNTLSPEEWHSRESAYQNKTKRLSERYDPMFSLDSVISSLEIVSSIDDVGKQLAYTFRSMLTSVHYECLQGRSDNPENQAHLGDGAQSLYVDHVANIHNPLSHFASPWSLLNRNVAGRATQNTEIFKDMRCEVDPKVRTDLMLV